MHSTQSHGKQTDAQIALLFEIVFQIQEEWPSSCPNAVEEWNGILETHKMHVLHAMEWATGSFKLVHWLFLLQNMGIIEENNRLQPSKQPLLQEHQF